MKIRCNEELTLLKQEMKRVYCFFIEKHQSLEISLLNYDILEDNPYTCGIRAILLKLLLRLEHRIEVMHIKFTAYLSDLPVPPSSITQRISTSYTSLFQLPTHTAVNDISSDESELEVTDDDNEDDEEC